MLVSIKINEVGWVNGKPVKWQAVVTIKSPNYEQRFFGLPSADKELAKDSLWKELHQMYAASTHGINFMAAKYGYRERGPKR